MAAILDFQVASRADLFSIPMRITVPNLALVSQFARFCLKMDFSCSTIMSSIRFSKAAVFTLYLHQLIWLTGIYMVSLSVTSRLTLFGFMDM